MRSSCGSWRTHCGRRAGRFFGVATSARSWRRDAGRSACSANASSWRWSDSASSESTASRAASISSRTGHHAPSFARTPLPALRFADSRRSASRSRHSCSRQPLDGAARYLRLLAELLRCPSITSASRSGPSRRRRLRSIRPNAPAAALAEHRLHQVQRRLQPPGRDPRLVDRLRVPVASAPPGRAPRRSSISPSRYASSGNAGAARLVGLALRRFAVRAASGHGGDCRDVCLRRRDVRTTARTMNGATIAGRSHSAGTEVDDTRCKHDIGRTEANGTVGPPGAGGAGRA